MKDKTLYMANTKGYGWEFLYVDLCFNLPGIKGVNHVQGVSDIRGRCATLTESISDFVEIGQDDARYWLILPQLGITIEETPKKEA